MKKQEQYIIASVLLPVAASSVQWGDSSESRVKGCDSECPAGTR